MDSTTLPVDAAATTLLVDPAAIALRATPLLMGTATHFPDESEIAYDPDKIAPLYNGLRLNSFRDDLYWPIFDPNGDGVTSNVPKNLRKFLSLTPATPVLILNQGNAKIEGGRPPVSDTGRAAFVDFARRAVRAIGDRDAIFEIFNEWNDSAAKGLPRLVGPGDPSDPRSSAQYAKLAKDTVAAIKATKPGARVILGSAANDHDWSWSQDVVTRGAMAQADGFSVHLYNHCVSAEGRSATNMIDLANTVRTKLATANAGRDVPMYITEWGWPNQHETCGGVDDAIAGPNIAQFSLFMAGSPWIAGGWLYEFKDQRMSSPNAEYNFGLFRWDLTEKPRTCFYREAMALIAEAQAIEFQRITTDVMAVKVRTVAGTRLAVWTTSTKTVAGQATVGGAVPFTARTMCGAAPATTGRSLSFGAAPVIIAVDTQQPVAFQVKRL